MGLITCYLFVHHWNHDSVQQGRHLFSSKDSSNQQENHNGTFTLLWLSSFIALYAVICNKLFLSAVFNFGIFSTGSYNFCCYFYSKLCLVV